MASPLASGCRIRAAGVVVTEMTQFQKCTVWRFNMKLTCEGYEAVTYLLKLVLLTNVHRDETDYLRRIGLGRLFCDLEHYYGDLRCLADIEQTKGMTPEVAWLFFDCHLCDYSHHLCRRDIHFTLHHKLCHLGCN